MSKLTMKDNQEQKFQEKPLILEISKTNMKWQKQVETKVQILENQRFKGLQKDQPIHYPEQCKVTTKGKIQLDLDLLKFNENDKYLI